MKQDFGLTKRALRKLVEMIATTTNALLEIVNFNVEGEQYVCAGTVSLLLIQGHLQVLILS